MSIIEKIAEVSPILWLYIVAINVVSLDAMGFDKYRAMQNKWRVPEKVLFILAAAGGSVGGIVGIYAFHHKTLHKKFTVGFPIILVLQLALLGYYVLRG